MKKDLGINENIIISVSHGKTEVALPAFSIFVQVPTNNKILSIRTEIIGTPVFKSNINEGGQ